MTGPVVDRHPGGPLAPYAMRDADTAGRRYDEPVHPYRGPFQRDRDRIVHCAAFRRLSSKTQVFTGELGDYHRTRLTHTLEVASLARTLARALRLNEDLVEALALAHDLGHPPFGHAGEDALDACLAGEGGFCHNRHGLRIVEVLEQRYQEFPGLNLSAEVLAGQRTRAEKKAGTPPPALLEVQVVDAADSIAYDTHDADDALELGLIELDELLELPLWRDAAAQVTAQCADLDDAQLRRAIVHRLIDWQIGDVLEQTHRRLQARRIDNVAEVLAAGTLVEVDAELSDKKRQLEAFLYDRVYRHPKLLRTRQQAQSQLRAMYDGYLTQRELLPESFGLRAQQDGLPRSVGDYLAGMTDRFAQREYLRLFDDRPARPGSRSVGW